MKNITLNLIQRFLQFLVRRKIKQSKPKIIVVSGSYGKTSTKEAIYFVLSKNGLDVGKNWGNMNSVLGLPMAILGLKKYSFGIGLIGNIIHAKWNFLFYRLPEILVLEFGVDKPGEMSQLVSVAKPSIAVITGISETHLEGLSDLATVKKEKNLLFKSLSKDDIAVKNASDENSGDLSINDGVKEITFGGSNSAVFASNIKIETTGTKFIMNYFSEKISVNSKLIGQHIINSLLIAAIVAGEFDISLGKIKETLEEIKPENGRMNPLKLRNGLVVIDDTYNSNPKSAEEALETLSKIEYSSRKVAILGNMNELGDYAETGHRRVGKVAGMCCDFLIAVGDNAKYFIAGAKESGMMADNIRQFASTEELIKEINNIIKPDDMVLVKGSQNRVRLERLVKYLLNNEKLASEVLVRQDKKWENK